MSAFDEGRSLDALAEFDSPQWLMELVLESFKSQDRGLGALYKVLEELARRYELADVVAVIDHVELGAQIFRLRGEPLAESELIHEGLAPGLYCAPDVVPPEVAAAAALACELALTTHAALHAGARDESVGVSSENVFAAELDRACARSARYGWGFTLVILELHYVSEPRQSSHVPEAALRQRFAGVLSETIRRGDHVARLAETRFGVILNNVEWGEFWSFVDRLRAAWRAESPHVDFYYGTAASPRDATTIEQILTVAETRLAERRERGIR